MRRSGNIGHVRETASRGGVCNELSCQKLKKACAGEGRECERALDDARLGLGNGTITMRKAIWTKKNFAKDPKILRLS